MQVVGVQASGALRVLWPCKRLASQAQELDSRHLFQTLWAQSDFLLFCRVNGHCVCDKHFTHGAGSFLNSAVWSEKPSLAMKISMEI